MSTYEIRLDEASEWPYSVAPEINETAVQSRQEISHKDIRKSSAWPNHELGHEVRSPSA